MTTPAQYRHQMDELKSQPVTGEGLTPAQARKALEKISELQKNAQELERAINLNTQVIRVQFRSRAAAATAGASSRVLVSNKRRMGSRMRAEETDQINAERDSKLAPYDEVRKEVEEYLANLAVVRAELEKPPAKAKTTPQKN